MKYPNRAYWAMPTAKKRPPIEPNLGKRDFYWRGTIFRPFPTPVTEPSPSLWDVIRKEKPIQIPSIRWYNRKETSKWVGKKKGQRKITNHLWPRYIWRARTFCTACCTDMCWAHGSGSEIHFAIWRFRSWDYCNTGTSSVSQKLSLKSFKITT